MSKSIQLALMAILFLGMAVLYYLQFSQPKLVYVDSARLISNYKGMVEARKVYQQKSIVWKANIDTLTNEVKQAIMDYERDLAKMTAKEKELSKELIRTKQKQLANYQRAMSDKAGQEDAEMTARVLDQVNAYIQKYGEDNGYQIILAATEYGNLAYAADGLDITEEILEGLNNSYSGQ